MRTAASAFVTILLLAALPGAARSAQNPAPLQFVDTHSHLLPNMSPEEEVAMLKRAGVTAVFVMSLPEQQQDLVRRYPGFVVPFVGFARSPSATQPPLDDATLAAFGRMMDAGQACGFGETGTMMDPREEPEVSLLSARYAKFFAMANSHHAPVAYHVDLTQPVVSDAFGRVAGQYPDMTLIMAHAGFNAGADVADRLLAAHRNIYVDVSIRLDPVNAYGDPPLAGLGPNTRSMMDAEGMLKPDWRRVMERFPDRFMFGMDLAPTGPKGREQRAVELTDIARQALGVLPRATQETIAHGNAERLLSRCKAGPKH